MFIVKRIATNVLKNKNAFVRQSPPTLQTPGFPSDKSENSLSESISYWLCTLSILSSAIVE